MPIYAYKVRDKKGKKHSGSIESASEKAAAQYLADKGYWVTTIKPFKHAKVRGIGVWMGSVPSADLIMFYLQLQNLLEAGVPLLAALQTLARQMTNRKFRRIVESLAVDIEGGQSFSEAMVRSPHAFHLLAREMVRVGETSGQLAKVLRYLAAFYEAREELRYKIRSSLAYPAVLMVASAAVIALTVTWLVPAFSVIFQKAGMELPLPTRIVYGAGTWVNRHILHVGVVFFAVAAGVLIALQNKTIKYWWDTGWLKCPLVGTLLGRIEISRWSRAIGLMLGSGVPMLQTLEMIQKITQNLAMRREFQETYADVLGGEGLAPALMKREFFPDDVVQMVATGEASGALENMLGKIGEFYDEWIARTLKQLTGMLEPFFILMMGGLIGFIMLSILLPIFDMIEIFKPH